MFEREGEEQILFSIDFYPAVRLMFILTFFFMSDCLLCPMPMTYEMMAYDTFTEIVVLTESNSWVYCSSDFSKYSYIRIHIQPFTVPVIITSLRVTDSASWFIEIYHDDYVELSSRWSIAVGGNHYVGETHTFDCNEYNYAGSVSAGFSVQIGLSGLGKAAANVCKVQGSVSIPIQFQCRV